MQTLFFRSSHDVLENESLTPNVLEIYFKNTCINSVVFLTSFENTFYQFCNATEGQLYLKYFLSGACTKYIQELIESTNS